MSILFTFTDTVRVQAVDYQYGQIEGITHSFITQLGWSGTQENAPQDSVMRANWEYECLYKSDNPVIAEGGEEYDTGNKVNALGLCDDPLASSGVLYEVGDAIAMVTTNLPASARVYVADVMQNINPAQPAYAQGIGFASLTPILTIWKAFRNIANFFMVIVFVLIGFAVMFRYKIGAQTVVNIQNSLPQLVITLLLINFSYAIAGLLIDIMYVAVFIVINVFKYQVFTGDGAALNGGRGVDSIAFGNILPNLLAHNFQHDVSQSIADVVVDIAGIDGPLAEVLSGITGVILYLVVLVVILINAFKVFFALLSSYIQILLNVILGPILLLLNAYPGSKSFTNWLRTIAAHLAVFPTIVFMLLLIFALRSDNVQSGVGYGSASSSNDPGGFSPPQLAVNNPDGYKGIIALGLILAMPTMIDNIKKFFGVEGGGAGDAFGGAALGGAVGAVAGRFAGAGQAWRGAITGGAMSGATQAAAGGAGLLGTLRGAATGAAGGAAGVGTYQGWRRRVEAQQRRDDYYKKMTEKQKTPQNQNSGDNNNKGGSTNSSTNSANNSQTGKQG